MVKELFVSLKSLICLQPSDSLPLIPNVMRVFLENGQTKSFKYDQNTCVSVSSLLSFTPISSAVLTGNMSYVALQGI